MRIGPATAASLFCFVLLASLSSVGVVGAVTVLPTGCTTSGIGISLTESQVYASAGTSIDYSITAALAAETDCNIVSGTLTLTTPDNVVHTVATGVSITRSSTGQSRLTATCAGTPSPAVGCQWNANGLYTAANADAKSAPSQCASVSIADPCDLHATGVISATSQTGPFNQGVTASNGISAVLIRPAMMVTKTVPAKVEVGNPILVSALVSNTGNIALSVTASDSIAGSLNCGAGVGVAVTVGPSSSATCIASIPTSVIGLVSNTVSATGLWSQSGGPSGSVSGGDSKSTMVVHPSLTIDSSVSQLFVLTGASVTYTYHVCNTGNVDVTVSVTDSIWGPIVTGVAISAGACQDFTNTVTVTGTTTSDATAVGFDQLLTQANAGPDSSTVTVITSLLSPPTIVVAPVSAFVGNSSMLNTTISFSGGAPPHTCQWMRKAPSAISFSNLGSSFPCIPSDLPGRPTGVFNAVGLWNYKLRVVDSLGPPETVFSNTVTVNVHPLPPAIKVTCNPSPVYVGKPTTCRAKVIGNSPTGKVYWSSDIPSKFSTGSCRLFRGSCGVKFTSQHVGAPVPVHAFYGGDWQNPTLQGDSGVDVIPRPSRMTLLCRPTTIRVEVPGAPNAFLNDEISICQARVYGFFPTGTVILTSSGSAQINVTATACTLNLRSCTFHVQGATVGSAYLEADYQGDPNNDPSSAFRTIRVVPNPYH